MSEEIKHECGIAIVRLLKPLEYYQKKYNTWQFGLRKLYLLMEKQHNRGQDGAGILSLKMNIIPGKQYFHHKRSVNTNPIQTIFQDIYDEYNQISNQATTDFENINWVKENLPYASQLYLGHLRYGTFGKNNIGYVHPLIRKNNWRTKSLAMAGNFNLTNVDELFNELINIGQTPIDFSDTVTILENIGHFLDEENDELHRKFKNKGLSKKEISPCIEKELDIFKILKRASRHWDGGYTIAGIVGHGAAFVMRDPWGIRPAFYYCDDEIVMVASERPVIQTVMNITCDQVNEINPGEAIVITPDGQMKKETIRKAQTIRPCSFERIYFSRGNDRDIYRERKKLGKFLVPSILKTIENDMENTVFSYIPNTAEVSFYGMIEEIKAFNNKLKLEKIKTLTENADIKKLLFTEPRIEKIAIKDLKLRTFISDDSGREDLVEHIYDILYGTIRSHKDTLIVIDDSIVRGTTLKKSIIRILGRLKPKKIIIVSSAPQIRYPDCYGIDMAKLKDFIAFQAAIMLLKENNMESLINDTYNEALVQQKLPKEEITNCIKKIYAPFTYEQISKKTAELLKPKDLKIDVEIIYQTVENLHKACPNNNGDWYFTGNYPTPGGNKVVINSFINFIEKNDRRAYYFE